MVVALLALALVQQAHPPELTVSLDRDEVAVGEEVLLTVRARSNSALPIELRIGAADGFIVVSRTEGTSVSPDAAVSRTKTLELRLRAIRSGQWKFGPFQARQGDTVAEVGALTVRVTDTGSAAVAAQINPRIRRLLEQARPPTARGTVGLSLLVSTPSATIGEQVDIVTAAWFPRELRLRLRRAPTLVPPAVEGMWSYPQPAPVGIAASRQVGGVWYDLFVAHQIAFPVRSGTLTIAPAQMQYSVPMALQFFSQEERFSVRSDSARIKVQPIPEAGRPPGFTGAVGTDLALDRIIEPPTARAREPVHVAFVLRGSGNVTLWPSPEVSWPEGSRAYPDLVQEWPGTQNGVVTGKKSFGFTVVADAVGTLPLPAVEYPYYDLGTRSFRVAKVPAVSLPVAEPAALAEGALPPPLLKARRSWIPASAATAPGPIGWLVLLLLPPMAWGGAQLVRHRSRRPPSEPGGRHLSARTVELELDGLVTGLAPAAVVSGDDSDLAAALRAAGLETAVVTQLIELRAQLRQRRYAQSQAGHDEDLIHRWDALRAQLSGGGRRRRVSHGLLSSLLLLVLGAGQAAAQGPSAETLYEQGAVGEARAAFAARAAAQPTVAAHWYNLGASDYRLGAPVLASAEWHRALRLAPRSASVRRALQLTPPPDAVSAARLWTAPFTASELATAALLCWLAAWTGLIVRRRWTRTWAWLGAAALLLGASAWWLYDRYAQPVDLVLRPVPLRVSPHGRGSALASLDEGQALLRVGSQRGWHLVRDPAGRLGWVPADAVIPANPE
ncbi:MAG TPA: BatD family protein [Gemmatimonadales bacterium]|nr:BatD family protein [Gemmatimonadales bacterium]